MWKCQNESLLSLSGLLKYRHFITRKIWKYEKWIKKFKIQRILIYDLIWKIRPTSKHTDMRYIYE